MEYVLLVFLIVVYSTQGLFMKGYNINYTPNKEDSSSAYTVMLGIVVTVGTLATRWIGAGGVVFEFTWITLLLGIINTVAIFFYNLTLVGASERGPFSIANIFMVAGGILMPLIVSIFMGSDLHWLDFVGIAVMFVAFLLLCLEKGEKTPKKPGFYLYCVFLMISNGVFSTVLALEDSIEGNLYKNELVIFTYLFGSVLAFILLAIKRRKRVFDSFKINGKAMGYALAAMTCITLGVNMLVICINYINPGVLYTVQNGGVMVLVAVFSLVLFKEKITLRKWIGIAVAAVSTVLLMIDPSVIGL